MGRQQQHAEAMVAAETIPFNEYLRQARRAAGLTQEELAERAGLSARAISDLERGLKYRPRKDTVQLLVQALELEGEEQARFEASARQVGEQAAAADVPAGSSSTPATRAGTSGVQTFLVADIRDYTAFTQVHGDEAAARLTSRFAAVVREIVGQWEGALIELRGDEALVALGSARGALRAALALQERFKEECTRDPTLPLRVGMGLDAGEAVPVEGGYRGGALNLAARLCSLAGDGEIFCSQTVIGLARRTEGIAFVDRGEVTLKGLPAPERVIQIAPDGAIPETLPPLQAVRVPPATTLPDEPTPFIGRALELEQLRGLVHNPAIRLVTLTGPGGTGKTRLAVQVGRTLLPEYRDGVVFVDLAPLVDPVLVPAAMVEALEVKEAAGKDLLDALIDCLKARHLLLVLDNYEHLLESASLVASLLDRCRELHVLVTSRIPLHLAREYEYAVGPLSVPDLTQLPDLESLSQCEAVTLFLERARAAKATFTLTPANAVAVAEICSRLDGLPLALELAAARIKLLPPQALLERLSRRLPLLTGGPQDKPTRQQTLRGAIDWSYTLLTSDERTLLARLAVFAGGGTLEAAEAVCAPAGELDLLEGVSSLIEKSLVRQEGEDEPRFRMLETIREYAGEKLAEDGEAAEVRQRHAEYFRGVAERADRDLTGPASAAAIRQLACEHDNIRAAMEWARERGDASMALRLVGALWQFWSLRGHLTEGRQWLSAALELQGADAVAPAERVKALVGAAILAIEQGAHDDAVLFSEQSVELARREGDRRDLVLALNARGRVDRHRDRYAEAAAVYEDALTIARELGDRAGEGAALLGLADIASVTGDSNRAQQLGEGVVAIFRERGDVRGLATLQLGRAFQAMHTGAYEQVDVFGGEALALFRTLGDTGKQAEALWALGMGAHWQGREEQADFLLEESLALRRARGDELHAASSLDGLGQVALNRGDRLRARRLLEEALAINRRDEQPWGWALIVCHLGHLELAEGKVARAHELFGESAQLFQTIGNPLYLCWALEGLAGVAAALQHWEQAARLVGAHDALLGRIGSRVPPVHPEGYTRTIQAVHAALGPDAFARATKAGEEAGLEGMIADALREGELAGHS